MPRSLKLLLWLLASAALLCVLLVIALSFANLSFAAPWISQRLSRQIDRPVQIGGDLYLDWQRISRHEGWRGGVPMPVVRAHDISVGNTEWATGGAMMAYAQYLQFQLDLFALPDQVARFADLHIRNGHLALEQKTDGTKNWTFGEPHADDEPSTWRFAVDRLTLADASVQIIDPTRQMDVMVSVSTIGTAQRPTHDATGIDAGDGAAEASPPDPDTASDRDPSRPDPDTASDREPSPHPSPDTVLDQEPSPHPSPDTVLDQEPSPHPSPDTALDQEPSPRPDPSAGPDQKPSPPPHQNTFRGESTSSGQSVRPYETRWTASGQFHGVNVHGEGYAGGMLALQHDAEPFPLEGSLSIGATTLTAHGTVSRPRDLSELALHLELSGPTMADLYPVLGLALPNTPPYQTAGLLRGQLDNAASRWVYEDFTGTVGRSDLRGTVTVQQRDPRPMLTAELASDLLRFEDLGPLIGAPAPEDVSANVADGDEAADAGGASDGGDEVAAGGANDGDDAAAAGDTSDSSDANDAGDGDGAGAAGAADDTNAAGEGNDADVPSGQITRSANQPDDKALPVQEVDRNMWRVMDAEVTFKGKRIESNANLPLDDVSAHVFLEDGVLRFDPLDFGMADGTLENTIKLDGNQAPIHAALEMQARGLRLAKLFPGVESMDAALGSVHGDASLTGRGNSVSELLSHASGQLSAVVTRGTVSRFLLEAAGLNVANMVFVKLFGDEQVMLQCLVAEFDIRDGVVHTETFVLETDDAVVTAEGQVNLATEAMDIDVYPDNKSLRIFTLRSPLYVAGTFQNPDVGVHKGPVAARAGAAVVLGVVATPLAALLPLLNVGTDDETTCTVTTE